VFEIYPERSENETTTTVRFGFTIRSVDEKVKRLREQSAQVLTEAYDSPWARRAVVQDLEGTRSISRNRSINIGRCIARSSRRVPQFFAPRDGYLASFSPTLINARYGGCLEVRMSRYRRVRRAGRLDWILPLCGFAEHSRRSTSARGIMIPPH
jgi:hypothetical protein